MKLQPLTTEKFIGGTVLITIAFAFLVYTQGEILPLFNLPLMFGIFVMMPSDIPKRPLTLTNFLVTLAALLVIPAWVWWRTTHRTPESEARLRSLVDSFSHPAIAVPLWFVFVYFSYRRWRTKPPPKDELPHEEK